MMKFDADHMIFRPTLTCLLENQCAPCKSSQLYFYFMLLIPYKLAFNMLVQNAHEDLGEDPGSWTHVNPTLDWKLACPMP